MKRVRSADLNCNPMREVLHHFHVSEPQLAPIGTGGIDHARFARCLSRIGYDRWCSIEMRPGDPFSVGGLEAVVEVAKHHYAGGTV